MPVRRAALSAACFYASVIAMPAETVVDGKRAVLPPNQQAAWRREGTPWLLPPAATADGKAVSRLAVGTVLVVKGGGEQ